MTTPPPTLAEAFGPFAADAELFRKVSLIAWPVMRRVTTRHAPEPTSHAVLTSQVNEAIAKASGAEATRIVLVSTGGSPFDENPITAYGETMPFAKSLTMRLAERWRPYCTERCRSAPGRSWHELKSDIWSALVSLVGEDIAGKDLGPQMESRPRSSASDSYMSILLWTFAAAVLGDEGAVNQLRPLLELAPVLLPLGETEEPGVWRCGVVGSPLIIRTL